MDVGGRGLGKVPGTLGNSIVSEGLERNSE